MVPDPRTAMVSISRLMLVGSLFRKMEWSPARSTSGQALELVGDGQRAVHGALGQLLALVGVSQYFSSSSRRQLVVVDLLGLDDLLVETRRRLVARAWRQKSMNWAFLTSAIASPAKGPAATRSTVDLSGRRYW
jgi:hypothetical protein